MWPNEELKLDNTYTAMPVVFTMAMLTELFMITSSAKNTSSVSYLGDGLSVPSH